LEIEMNKTTTPATFAVGDRVTVTLPQTGEQPALATIEAIKSGWYVCHLFDPAAHPLAKGGIVSARAGRIAFDFKHPDGRIVPAAVESDGPVFADLGSQERSALRAMARTHCPECESEDLESELLANGKTRTTCNDCDWTSDEAEDEVEEALEEAETAASKMAEALRKARQHYVKARRPSGAATAHNGDTIARELLDYEPAEVAALADRCLSLPKGWHAARYDGLNPGQVRMNSGNKIRGAWKKAEKEGDVETLARIKFVLGLDQDDTEDDEVEALASIEDRGPEGIEDLQPVEQA
jgi:hypothetical protein